MIVWRVHLHTAIYAYLFTYLLTYLLTLRWRRGVVVERRIRDREVARVRVSAGHYGVKTLGKFLTPMVSS